MEPLVWTEEHVVCERDLEPLLEVLDGQGAVEARGVLEGTPEAFEAGGGVDVRGGGDTLPDAEPPDGFGEHPTPELAAEIGDEVLRGAERTSVTSIIQTWFTKRAITGRRALGGSGGAEEGRGTLARILRTERAESFQPAAARLRAIASWPPKPERAMRSIVARTVSANRRIGGTGFTVEPAVLA